MDLVDTKANKRMNIELIIWPQTRMCKKAILCYTFAIITLYDVDVMFGALFRCPEGTKRISQCNFKETSFQCNPRNATLPSHKTLIATLIHSSCNFGEQTLWSLGGVVKVQSTSRYNPGQTIPAKTPSPSRAPEEQRARRHIKTQVNSNSK